MRRVAASLLIAMAVLALTAVIVSNSGSSQANNEQGDQSTPDPQPLALSEAPETTNNVPDLKPNTQTDDADAKGFVGISISSLHEAEADELGIEGGVLVNHVIDDGPSAGILLVGDVITTVNGHPVAETKYLIDFVWSVEPGDTVAFTVVRDGETLDLSVVAGERKLPTVRKFAQRIPGGLRDLQGLRGLGGNVFGRITDALFDRFVSAEVVVKTDDGFMTIAAVTGTVRSVNIGAGTFLLDAADGNGDIEFTISDDTMVNLTTQGDLSGLNTTDRALVVTVDGAVRLVGQGGDAFGHNIMRLPRIAHDLFGDIDIKAEDVVSATVVVNTDDGQQSFSAVQGIVTTVEVGDRSFSLLPADNSAEVSFKVSDDTKVKLSHVGDLGGLNTTDKTLVISKNGEVTVVSQGDFDFPHTVMGPFNKTGPRIRALGPRDHIIIDKFRQSRGRRGGDRFFQRNSPRDLFGRFGNGRFGSGRFDLSEALSDFRFKLEDLEDIKDNLAFDLDSIIDFSALFDGLDKLDDSNTQ